MSLAEIEAELDKMSVDELRQLALKSWKAFRDREVSSGTSCQCDEDDPQLLAALDEAVAKAETSSRKTFSGTEVRSRLRRWTSK